MGKILLLSFGENEDEILNQILTFLNTGDRTYNLLEHTIKRKLILSLRERRKKYGIKGIMYLMVRGKSEKR